MEEIEEISSVSSYNPDPNTAFTYPYVISKEYFRASQLKKELNHVKKLNEAKVALIALLEAIKNAEKNKEENFIKRYSEKVGGELGELITNENYTISQRIDMIQKHRANMINNTKSLKKDLEEFKKKWYLYTNTIYLNLFNSEEYKDLKIEDLTIEGFIQKIGELLKEQTRNNGTEYDKYLTEIISIINQMASEKYKSEEEGKVIDFFTKKIGTLQTEKREDFFKINYKKDYKKKMQQNLTVVQSVENYICGIINGMFTEQFLIQYGSGIGTGRVNQYLRVFSKEKATNIPIQIKSDVIQLVSFNANIDVNETVKNINDELSKKGQNNIETLRNQLDTLDPDNNFVIHISAKDYFLSNNAATINNQANLDTMLYPLKDINNSLENKNIDIQELIFAMMNAGKNAIYDTKTSKEKIREEIFNICMVYMFEDYVDIFKQSENTSVKGNHLHLYFINGQFYSISDILNSLIDNLSKPEKERVNYIRINFEPTQITEFSPKILGNEIHGKDRWEMVRKNTLLNSSLGIHMNYKQLYEKLYKDIEI